MTPNDKKTPSAVELAADDVLAVILRDRSAYEVAVFEHGMMAAFMPTRTHQVVYRAVCELYDTGLSVHDTAILDRCEKQVTVEWLAQRFALYDATRTGKVFAENIHLLRKHSERRETVGELQRTIQRVQQGEDEQAINELMTFLAGAGHKPVTAETAGEHGRMFRDFMDSDPVTAPQTGLPWLDGLTGGFEPGHLWWVAGPYKSRKTTFMLNMALSAMLTNPHVNAAILSREMPKQRINAQLVAMMAVGHLKQQGQYQLADDYGHALHWISATSLIQSKKRYRQWHPLKATAVDVAIDAYWKLDRRLRVYDTTPDGGGLDDVASLQRMINRDIAMYGGSLFFIDYLQLFRAPGAQLYDRVSYTAQMLQSIAQSKQVTLVIVAQQNEATIQDGGDSYSPGIKGGGDPAQTADYLLTTKYKQDEDNADDNFVTVNMKLSRHGQGGSKVKTDMPIHPNSGLLLDSSWLGGRQQVAIADFARK